MAKLDGTLKLPNSSAGAAVVEQTQLQQSIFNAPLPGSAEAKPAETKVPAGVDHVMNDAGTPESRGQKRTRDEDDESDGDAEMEVESDDE